MEYSSLIFSWGSPVGVGIFLVLGALAFYIVSKASKNLQHLQKSKK